MIIDDELHEECGVFGIYNNPHASTLTYYGLHALQHRGQEGAGIACSDTSKIQVSKGHGLIKDVFDHEKIESLKGIHAIGHVRYSTAGGNEFENIQPLYANLLNEPFALCHNGQIINALSLRKQLEETGSIFQGTSDSEILMHLIQREKGTFLEKIQKAFCRVEGAFAVLILTKDCIYAIRDHHGLRPLSIASLPNGIALSSESCAFISTNADLICDVEPGQIIAITPDGIFKHKYRDPKQHMLCSMEYVYFSRPDSDIDGVNVHDARLRSGEIMARKDKKANLQADIVVGVPDSSTSAAIGYAKESGIPYEIGLIKNRYVGRTFIQPTQELREQGVKMKLSPIPSIVANKDIILIDDSIVRGTTSRRIVQLLKEAGANKVHVRIASPAITHPCIYGVDTSTYEELISARMNLEELREYIRCDSLRFLEIEDLFEAFQRKQLCHACFSGNYPTDMYDYCKLLHQKK